MACEHVFGNHGHADTCEICNPPKPVYWVHTRCVVERSYKIAADSPQDAVDRIIVNKPVDEEEKQHEIIASYLVETPRRTLDNRK